jgi:hypothetical protein
MAKKKKVVKKRSVIRRDYNLEDAILTMTDREGHSQAYNFNGLRHDVLLKLAMVGAGSLLCKRDKPLVLWEKIRQNKFGQERNYNNLPKTVHALARLNNVSIEKAAKAWKELDKEQRNNIKKDPDVRKEILRMQIEAID